MELTLHVPPMSAARSKICAIIHSLWRLGEIRTHHKVTQPPLRLQGDGDSEPPKTVNPNIISPIVACIYEGEPTLRR
jgi:hypothetical protein